jgi:hypothetical protein
MMFTPAQIAKANANLKKWALGEVDKETPPFLRSMAESHVTDDLISGAVKVVLDAVATAPVSRPPPGAQS